MNTILLEERMQCTAGSSDKVYNIFVEMVDDGYRTRVEYGRRGGRMINLNKYYGSERTSAISIAEEIRLDKLKHGYHTVSTIATDAVPPEDRRPRKIKRAPEVNPNTVEFYDNADRKVIL